MMKCNTCGYDDNGTGDFAHVCWVGAIKSPVAGQDRIKELWEQGAQCSWPRPGKFTAGEYDYHLVQFAALIVKECAQLCFDLADKSPTSEFSNGLKVLTYNIAGETIKEHFGVD